VKEYTYSQARQQLATLLREARVEGAVRIRRRDGEVFMVQPAPASGRSPLDVPGVGVAATMADVLRAVRESRRSTGRLVPRAPEGRRRKPARRASRG
jgi:hypothetical protein